VREYLNSPPDLEGEHLTAGRDLYIAFLQEAGEMSGLDFFGTIRRLRKSIAIIPELAEAIRQNQLEDVAACFHRVAEAEVEAYAELSEIVGARGVPRSR
jgi:hypothetical protein